MVQLQTPGVDEAGLAGAGAVFVGIAHGYSHTRFGQASALGPAAVGTTGKVVVGAAFVSLLAAQSVSFY
jgi:hypothetical protein